MSSKISLFLKSPKSSDQLKASLAEKSDLKYEQLQELSNFLQSLKSGNEAAVAVIEIGDASESGAAAEGDITISGSGAQSVTINGEALVGGTDYEIADLTASEIAENLEEAIANSQSSRVQAVYVSARSAGVLTLKAKAGGEVGNLITTAATGDAAAESTELAGGVDGPQNIYKFNLAF